ncbi:uncharacterized protein LOC142507486 [Primulina tabacum]|uniref:uncharacterized protein LOC142507486 n=1 Tax=Primulina tabacum TaxID=48773 RepID=UPI003F5A8695
MAASLSEVSTREVLHVSRLVLSIEEEALSTLENSWMTSLIKFIVKNELPVDKARAQKIKRQPPRFDLLNNILYRRSFQGPLLKCLSEGEVEYVLREINEGCCAEHLGGISLARKTMLAGFWWPTLSQNSTRVVQGKEIRSWCREMKITQYFTFVAYPQANGQTEVVNRIIVQALKTRLQGKGKDWVEELPSVLWAYRTTPRAPTQETPFNLVYGSEAVLPVEIGQTSSQSRILPG